MGQHRLATAHLVQPEVIHDLGFRRLGNRLSRKTRGFRIPGALELAEFPLITLPLVREKLSATKTAHRDDHSLKFPGRFVECINFGCV